MDKKELERLIGFVKEDLSDMEGYSGKKPTKAFLKKLQKIQDAPSMIKALKAFDSGIKPSEENIQDIFDTQYNNLRKEDFGSTPKPAKSLAKVGKKKKKVVKSAKPVAKPAKPVAKPAKPKPPPRPKLKAVPKAPPKPKPMKTKPKPSKVSMSKSVGGATKGVAKKPLKKGYKAKPTCWTSKATDANGKRKKVCV